MIDGEPRGDPRTIDGPWMTEALEAAGVARGATVTDVEMVGFIGTGQMCRNARLRLTWDDPDGRPATVVGKFPSDDDAARLPAFANGAYLREVAFYAEVANTLDVDVPTCWVHRYDADEPDFVLIMEDMAESAQGDQFQGCTMDEAALAVEQAVALHAPRWGDPTLSSTLTFAGTDAPGDQIAMFYGMMLPGFEERIGPRLTPEVVQLARDFGSVIQNWRGVSTTPRTVVHGDFRPENFLFGRTESARPLVIVDWQTVGLGAGPTDLAYLFGGSFVPAHRRETERDLLADYRARLAARGIDYSEDDCWRDYRLGSLHGVLITVLASVLAERTARGDDLFTLMATRHAGHALELDALALLR
jgi:hypothetical protein